MAPKGAINYKVMDIGFTVVKDSDLKSLRENLGIFSSQIEYKLRNPQSERKLITEEETFNKIREIINLVNKL